MEMKQTKKQTGKFGRTMGWLVSFFMIACLSSGMVWMYPIFMRESREIYTANIDTSIQQVAQISWETFWESFFAMDNNYLICAWAFVCVAILLGFLLPAIRPLGLQEGWKANIPLELIFIGVCVLGVLVGEELPTIILQFQIELDFRGAVLYWIDMIDTMLSDEMYQTFLLSLNRLLWFGIFFGFYLFAVSLRQVSSKGLWRYLKENTMVGRILYIMVRWLRKVVVFCGEIDFDNKGNRKLLLFVLGNAIVIAVFSCTWFFGILLAIPYSMLLFFFLQKKWKQIRTDYEVLLATTREMADGVTEVEYLSEAGIFHELREVLAGVQEGFHRAVQEEVRSQKMKTELVTNVSHDLKTPLTAIITYVDLLKNEELPSEECREYVRILEQKSSRLKCLIEDLFEVSKATSGNIQLDKVDLDLVQLLLEVRLELEDEIMNSGIEFKINLPDDKIMVHLDAQKTERIFENLIGNIIKHGLHGSRAYIEMKVTQDWAEVILKNISAYEISYDSEEIMERFTRGDASRNTEGSGLGLAIVKSFVQAQDGTVKIELDGDLFKVTVGFARCK